jgi:hypothetical protein
VLKKNEHLENEVERFKDKLIDEIKRSNIYKSMNITGENAPINRNKKSMAV